MIHYLDEQIQVTINFNNITIDESGLYRYDLIDDVGDDPLFIGNCYIEKGASSRSIDITDLVRSLARYDANLDFQVGYIVKIYNKNQTAFDNSSATVVVPIYRYPNRKSRLETSLQETETNWYVPSLQGYNYSNGEFKTPDLLPKVPFISTEQLDYKLLVNYGTLDAATKSKLKLYTGIDKDLNINNNSLTYTNYTLKDLFTSDKEVETITWNYNQDNLFTNFYVDMMPVKDNTDNTCAKYITNLAPLQYKFTTYKQIDNIEYSNAADEHATYTISGYPFNADLRVNNIQVDNYFDIYLNGSDNSFVNLYPNVTTNCNATVNIIGKYAPNNYIDLITNTTAGEITGNYILEKDTAGSDTFKIEIGKTQAAGDIPDKTFEHLTIGDTIEFDDTSDSQWLKLYDSTGTLIDTLTFNASVMEEGSWKEYGIKLEEINTYLALFPLQQVYNFTLDFKTFVQQSITTHNDTIDIRQESSKWTIGYFDNTTAECKILYGNGTVGYINKQWNIEIKYDNASRITHRFTNIYAITGNNDVVYFQSVNNKQQLFNPKSQITGLYIVSMAVIDDNYYIEQVEFTPFDKTKYVKAFYYTGSNSIISTGGATSYYDIRNVSYTITPPYTITPVASIDYCPAKYYLQWRDRYGSMQMQPFEKIDTYSESFTTSETKDYRNNRRVSNVSIQPKWKLNTGWLNDNVYPYYESLFVSPYLTLYDTQEDKSYPVIVTNNDYTEKTFRNQSRQQFNLQLDVELNNTQNILY